MPTLVATKQYTYQLNAATQQPGSVLSQVMDISLYNILNLPALAELDEDIGPYPHPHFTRKPPPMQGQWQNSTQPGMQYLYNGKEWELGLEMGWLAYGFRWYDASIGRFTGVDPIGEKFAWVSVYNYAENSPIANIDLWGLQAVYFSSALKNNTTFQSAFDINRKTTEGNKFGEILSKQNKVDVLYVEFKYSPEDGFTSPNIFYSSEEFKSRHQSDPLLKKSLKIEEGLNFFEENPGKGLLIIGINAADCVDDCSYNSLLNASSILNHEEGAHAVFKIIGKQKSNIEGHGYYYGEESNYSPTNEDVDSNDKYKNSIAKKNLDQIKKIINDEYY